MKPLSRDFKLSRCYTFRVGPLRELVRFNIFPDTDFRVPSFSEMGTELTAVVDAPGACVRCQVGLHMLLCFVTRER